MTTRHTSIGVRIGSVTIGGGAPIVVQAMTDTDTANAAATAKQCAELAAAGAELVRMTVDRKEAAAAVVEIRSRLDDLGCDAPLIGDFHFNGHVLLREYEGCATVLAKYRVNPGNVGRGDRRDTNFSEICAVARDHGKAIRIGVNRGSLDSDLVTEHMERNASREAPLSSEEVLQECMVVSALKSIEAAIESAGSAKDCVDPWLIEIQSSYNAESKRSHLAASGVIQIANLAEACITLRQPASPVEGDCPRENPTGKSGFPSVPLACIAII